MTTKNLTTRSIAAAAVTGALVLGSAGVAQADDDRSRSESASQSESSTGAKAPITFGGVTVTNDGSQADSSRAASTEDDGDESTSSQTTDRSDTSQRLHIGGFTVDPSFFTEAAEAQREAEQSCDDGDDQSRQVERESAGRSGAKAPVKVEGSDARTEQDRRSTESTTTRDDDETSHQEDSSGSHDEQGVATGDSTLDPLFGSENGERESLVDQILK